MNNAFLKGSLLLAGLLAFLIGGCSPSVSPASPTPMPEEIYTQAAQTILADLTQNAPQNTATPPPAIPTATLVELQVTPPTSTPPPSATPPASMTPIQPSTALPLPSATQLTGTLLFEDDFSSETGWADQQQNDWSMGYIEEGYFIEVAILYAPIWSVRNEEFEDIRLEVDASRLEGPEDGYYGLVCRHQNGDNYYTLVVSDDGFYGIGLVEDGEKLRFLQEGTAPAGVLNPAGSPNRLRADCVGSTLSLYANGVKLAEVQDDTIDSGEAGMLAGTRQQPGLVALFDNLVARSP